MVMMETLVAIQAVGIKSTFNIDRETAINVIVSKINRCSNEQLANMLEEFDESYFRNYIVDNELPDNPDDYKTIYNFNDFLIK